MENPHHVFINLLDGCDWNVKNFELLVCLKNYSNIFQYETSTKLQGKFIFRSYFIKFPTSPIISNKLNNTHQTATKTEQPKILFQLRDLQRLINLDKIE